MIADSWLSSVPTFASHPWQMSYGERAALEGIVAQLRPKLALEIGTAEGGSLRRIAAHSEEVHSFDLVAPGAEVAKLGNVSFHTGDGHVLLPEWLEQVARVGRNIDFALVDGDHTAGGVKADLDDLLRSPAVQKTVVIMHDTMNPIVREGVEGAGLERNSKVVYLDLDFVPGYLARSDPYRLQLWGGLGLLIVDAEGDFNEAGPIRQNRFHELFSVVRPAVDTMKALESGGLRMDQMDAAAVQRTLGSAWRRPAQADSGEVAELTSALEYRNRLVREIQTSASWRLTAPLRALKRYVQSRASR